MQTQSADILPKILVIDDDPDIIIIMRALLKDFLVASASKEEEVHYHLASIKPDLILLDVLLSGADGREICRKIKATASTKDIPVVMFSAHPGAKKNIKEYGADDFISKPLQGNQLLEIIKDHLAKKQVV